MTTDDDRPTPDDPTPAAPPTEPTPAAPPPVPSAASPNPAEEPPAPIAPLEQPDDGLARAQRISALQTYLSQYRDRYTAEALRRAALGVGYTAAEIDQASATAAAVGPDAPVVGWTPPSSAATKPGPAVLPTLGTIVASIAGLWGVATILGLLTGNTNLYGFVYLIGIGLAVLGWVVLRQDHPSVARGLGCTVLLIFILPLAVFVAILGYCVVTGNVIGNP